METIILTNDTCLPRNYAATIGFLDGVHAGHCFLVEQLRRAAAAAGWQSMVITFDRHPRQVLDDHWQPHLLTTFSEKQALLQQTGIDCLVVLPFNREMAVMSARQFIHQVLRRQLGVNLLLTGYDNHFGHRTADSCESHDDYVGYGREVDITILAGTPLQAPFDSSVNVSSSLVRRLLAEGRVEDAATCLGRYYSLSGTVVRGEQQGRLMGFPTANLQVASSQRVVPQSGVYAVRAMVGADGHLFEGMTNIGTRPTFGDHHQQTIETHLFGFTADLYDQPLSLQFVARLREERLFGSPAELARQMTRDAAYARQALNSSIQSSNPSQQC